MTEKKIGGAKKIITDGDKTDKYVIPGKVVVREADVLAVDASGTNKMSNGKVFLWVTLKDNAEKLKVAIDGLLII